jgi:hypothetical protein
MPPPRFTAEATLGPLSQPYKAPLGYGLLGAGYLVPQQSDVDLDTDSDIDTTGYDTGEDEEIDAGEADVEEDLAEPAHEM